MTTKRKDQICALLKSIETAIDISKVKNLTPPLGRTGKTSDIASAILFLVAPASEWITGQTLVDGGHLNS